MIKNYWALFYLTLIGMIIFVSLFILGLVVSIANWPGLNLFEELNYNLAFEYCKELGEAYICFNRRDK